MTAFVASFIFILLAEMGDKTQLLSMAFAAKYSAYKVLIAVFLATLLNHVLAVWAGRFLTVFIPMGIISFAAAFSFIIFGLWTIRGDKLKDEDEKESRYGVIATVGIAFFLAEMGDKTQLATISLAIKYQNMINVLMGTTLGMVIADAIGITIGIIMRKHIPERIIKWVSAGIFILFGLIGIYQILSTRLNPPHAFFISFFITASSIYGAYYLSKLKKNIKYC